MKRPFVLFLVAALLVPPILLAAAFFGSQPNLLPLGVVVSLVSYAVLVLQLTYRHIDRVYLFVERLRLQFIAGGAAWGARAEFDQSTDLPLSQVAQRLLGGEPVRTLARDDDAQVLSVNGLTTKIAVQRTTEPSSGEATRVLTIEIVPAFMPLRRATQLATEFVPALFERARELTGATGEKYSTEIVFSGSNPYFGLFLRDLQGGQVAHFVVELNVSAPGDPSAARVTASPKKVTIVTSRVATLSTLSRRYLALASG